MFEKRKYLCKILAIGAALNQKHGKDLVRIDLKDQYFNMKEKIVPVMHIVDIAEEVMKELEHQTFDQSYSWRH